MKIKAIHNAVIVKPITLEKKQSGNIIVPDLGKEKNKLGEVISVGPGHLSINGTLIPTTVKEGDIVVLPTMGFTKLEVDSEEYWVGVENQVLGIIEK